jgi:hypothetical protein
MTVDHYNRICCSPDIYSRGCYFLLHLLQTHSPWDSGQAKKPIGQQAIKPDLISTPRLRAAGKWYSYSYYLQDVPSLWIITKRNRLNHTVGLLLESRNRMEVSSVLDLQSFRQTHVIIHSDHSYC